MSIQPSQNTKSQILKTERVPIRIFPRECNIIKKRDATTFSEKNITLPLQNKRTDDGKEGGDRGERKRPQKDDLRCHETKKLLAKRSFHNFETDDLERYATGLPEVVYQDGRFHENKGKIMDYVSMICETQRRVLIKTILDLSRIRMADIELSTKCEVSNTSNGETFTVRPGDVFTLLKGQNAGLAKDPNESLPNIISKSRKCQRCCKSMVVFKKLMNLKHNRLDVREQTQELIASLKSAFLDSHHAKLSVHFKEFIIDFFMGRSLEMDFERLTRADVLMLLTLMIKKQYPLRDLRCLCFESMKDLESKKTRRRNDELLKFYVNRMFKEIAKEKFPNESKERKQLALFYESHFGPYQIMDSTYSSQYWFKKSKLFRPEVLEVCGGKVKSINHFIRMFSQLPSFLGDFEPVRFKRRHREIIKGYEWRDMQKKGKSIMALVSEKCGKEKGNPGDFAATFGEILSGVVLNQRFKVFFSGPEIERACVMVMDYILKASETNLEVLKSLRIN